MTALQTQPRLLTIEGGEGAGKSTVLRALRDALLADGFEVVATRQLHHDLVSPPSFLQSTARPAPGRATPVYWDRPILHVEIDVQSGQRLHVVNLHLRAPLAAPIEGQKLAPFVWRSVAGWAEGFFVAAMKRSGQALEARLAVERIFDASPEAWIAVAGDFNADMREVPVRILCGDVEDTGNAVLASRRLAPLERSVPATARYSVLHHGERLMLDHLLVSPHCGGLGGNDAVGRLAGRERKLEGLDKMRGAAADAGGESS